MFLRISRRTRLILGICSLAALGRHFRSFVQVNDKLRTLDIFHQDIISSGRNEHWNVPEKKRDPFSSSSSSSSSSNLAKNNGQRHALLVENKAKQTLEEAETGNEKSKQNNVGAPPSSTAFQNRFYQDHYQSLYDLSLDNLLVWKSQDDDSSFSRFWEHFDYYHSPAGEELVPFNISHFLRIDDSICRAALSFNEHLNLGNRPSFLKQVLLFKLEEDMGGFSSPINNETGLPNGKALTDRWIQEEGCSEFKVFAYLSHPNTRAVFTTQYQVYDERKIHSIPLGLRSLEYAKKILHRTKQLRGHTKRTLFLMADSPPNNDSKMNKVFARFKEQGYPVQNTFGTNVQNYLDKLTTSKFMLLPNGVADSYQLWEALFSGCIPIMQHFGRFRDGWFRTTEDLPVAWIDSYDNLTPQWLEQEYEKLVKRNNYKWQKLTQQWWIDFIKSFVPDEGKLPADNTQTKPSSDNIHSSPIKGGVGNSNMRQPQDEPIASDRKDLETIFYERQHQSLSNVSADDMLVWEARKKINGTTFSRFFEHFDYYQPDPDLSLFSFNKSNFLRVDYNICQAALAFNADLSNPDTVCLPHVLFHKFDEDVGGFSSPIEIEDGLTIKRDLHSGWREFGCSEGQTFQYVSHPKVRAVITTQFQIYKERNIYSIPLGMQSDENGLEILKRIQKHEDPSPRTQLAMAHADPDAKSITSVIKRFEQLDYVVKNTFAKTDGRGDSYFENLASSKFILSSRGTSFDGYQHWEALFAGCIPVIEHFNHTIRNGWLNTFDDLPVAWIDSYDNLTPQWLEQEYDKLLQKAEQYKWEKLTRHWWIDFVKAFLKKKRP